MATNTATTSGGGIGFFGFLALLFIALKLTGVIAWSWLWVLAPLWIPAVIGLAALAVFGIILLIAAAVK